MTLNDYLKSQNLTQKAFAAVLNADSAAHGINKTATQGAIWQWLQSKIPAERLPQLERISGGKLKAEFLRPDLFPILPIEQLTPKK